MVTLVSCERFLEVELPGQEPRMVLNALLEPSDSLTVFLTKSKGVLEGRASNGEFELVEGANVYLKDQEGRIYPLEYINRSSPYETNAYYYLSGHEFLAGQTYEIIAEKEGFPTITSEQKLPDRIQLKSIDIINLGPVDGNGNNNELEITVKFDDPPGSNFYEISGSFFASDTVIIEGIPYVNNYFLDPSLIPVNPVYKKDYLMRPVLLFSDNLFNGSVSEMVFRTTIPRNVEFQFTIKFSHISESYYRFYDTADLQRSNRGDILSQPVLVYNNINNGMGIFKSRNTDQKVIKIRVGD
ncbi:hypothetical protein EL17_13890 [Anditalea andensis]|uniref:DUF4249 domain-containing protein n=2 Tax=Anditalea andensis TaxID=1048983 RepID=A0A074KTX3_9BACT|nr:hypothetical protein EL17_13890 [Anditalea andensis]